MASDLGLKATVEFEAEGQQQVLAQVNALQAGMKAMEQAFAGPASAAGLFSTRFERDARAAQIVSMGWAGTHQQAMAMIAAASEGAAQANWAAARSITQAAQNAGNATSGLGSALSQVQGKLAMVGVAVGFQQLVAQIQAAGQAVIAWGNDFETASVNAMTSLDRLRGRMRELASENERVRIGVDIRSQIAQLESELGNVKFDERAEQLNPWKGLKAGFEDYIAGFDTGAAKIQQIQQQLFDLRKLQAQAEAQPLANAGAAEAEAARKAAADAAKARAEAKAEYERQLELNYAQDDRRRWEGRMDAAGENPLKQAQVLTAQLAVEQQKLNALKAVALDYEKMSAETIAMQAEKTRQAQDRVDELTRAQRQKQDEVWKRDEDQKKAGRMLEPDIRFNFDRLTRVGATLGDPVLAGPSRRDPTYHQERANDLLREILNAMRDNRRANYASPAAYED